VAGGHVRHTGKCGKHFSPADCGVKHFQAGSLAKALIAGGGSVGLLLSPLVVTAASRIGWPTSIAASRLLALGSVCFLLAAALPVLPVYCICAVIGMATSSAIIPLLTHMYQENYPEKERGRRFSRTFMIRILVTVLFSEMVGRVLDGHLHQFPWLMVVFAATFGAASFCLSQCPTTPLQREESAHPFRAFRFVREDKLFRRTLICWMLMGFANLMMFPLRVEYLGSPKFLNLSVQMVTLLVLVIPNIARLALSPLWGHLFDRMNFFALRVTLNIGFALGILTFFTSNSLLGLIIGGVIFGISNAGGDVAWSLWVTKFAPPGRVADYMSVHTYLTGCRGVLAPLLAFYLIHHWTLWAMAAFSAALIIGATLLLLPELKFGAKAKSSAPLLEEVSE